MKNNELVFIIDQSGSMGGREEDTAGSFNTVLKEQLTKEYQVLVTTVLFSDNHHMIHDRLDAKKIEAMKGKDIRTAGCTALYDAVGDTIEHIEMVHRYIREEDKPEHVLFVIITDGMENASRNYRSADIQRMISRKKEEGWQFAYLGADLDAAPEAEAMHISPAMAVSFRKESGLRDHVGNAINTLANRFFGLSEEEVFEEACPDWREALDEDYRNNH